MARKFARFVAVSKSGKRTKIFVKSKKKATALANLALGGRGGKLIERKVFAVNKKRKRR